MRKIDLSLLLSAVLLVLISLATFYSLNFNIFKQQLVYFLISIVFYFIFLNVNLNFLSLYSKQFYFIMIGSLLFLYFIGIEAKGAVRWVDIFGLRIQFSEIFKPFIIIFFASFLSRDESKSFIKFIKSLLYIAPVFILTLRQPDLGNAMIYLITIIFLLFIYGFPISYFIFLALMLLLPIPFLFQFLHDYQKQRIFSFLNFSNDPFGSSYNAIQSIISVGSGGFSGKGFGQATQSILKFLPERHTDFIFATIAENLGFVGAVILLSLYVYLLYRVFSIAREANDRFSNLVLGGFFSLFLVHIFLNVGMNIGLLPIVGITLPFVSYGGSSLLTNFTILGIISSIRIRANKKYSIEIR